MKRIKQIKEIAFYPIVEKWAKRHFGLFRTHIKTGLRYSRFDVAEVREIGGDWSGDVEVISIQKKFR